MITEMIGIILVKTIRQVKNPTSDIKVLGVYFMIYITCSY